MTWEFSRGPAQCQLCLHDELTIDGSGCHGIDKIGHAGRDTCFQADDLTGLGSAKKFYGSQSGELEISDRFQNRIRLGHGPDELGGRFQQQHPGEQRFSGKVAGQKGFIAPYFVLSGAAFARIQASQPIQKAELGAVWKAAEGGGEEIGHWMLSGRRICWS